MSTISTQKSMDIVEWPQLHIQGQKKKKKKKIGHSDLGQVL